MPVRETYVDSELTKLNSTIQSRIPFTSQNTARAWATVYEDSKTGIQSCDFTRLFKILEYIDSSAYTYIVMVEDTVRLDNLAHHIYGDPRLWWAIRLANFDDSELTSPFSALKIGKQIKYIPMSILMTALKRL